MRLVLGLGNPGAEYAGTRHNAGAWLAAEAARALGIELTRRSRDARWGDGWIEGQRLLVALPKTYMNLSGRAAASFAQAEGLDPADILVLVDDWALEPGRLRLRLKGSAGGHNGLASIIESLGSDAFPRLRLGIGPPPPRQDPARYVLGRLPREHAEALRLRLDDVVGVIRAFAAGRLADVLEKTNRPVGTPGGSDHGKPGTAA